MLRALSMLVTLGYLLSNVREFLCQRSLILRLSVFMNGEPSTTEQFNPPETLLDDLVSSHLGTMGDFIPTSLVSGLLGDLAMLRRSPHAQSLSASADHGSVQWFELQPKRQPAAAGTSVAREQLFDIVDGLQRSIERRTGILLEASLTELKYAYYPTGGRYQRHMDALNVGRIAREFSFILYLNSDWGEADGGKLRVFEYAESAIDGFVDVAPRGGSVVLFKSDRVPHEVLSTSAKRVAIVGWFHREVTAPEVDESALSPLALAIMEHYKAKGMAVSMGGHV
jgi:predicted 2-oxoglutarate/Fe(II)-dependent dioxygenase YbiX